MATRQGTVGWRAMKPVTERIPTASAIIAPTSRPIITAGNARTDKPHPTPPAGVGNHHPP